MRISFSLLAAVAMMALLSTGCGGMERKLGRGLNNMTEFARQGEMMRSVEQTALFEGPEVGYTRGVIMGFDRTIIRTAIGVAEVATFPFPMPTYDQWKVSDKLTRDPTTRLNAEAFGPAPVYADSYKPRLINDSIFSTDTSLGFSGGDIVPFVPGSRFRVFDHN